ncbi:MAG TPA: VC_2705 family sodium/solute symporter, partial [Ramlibacter sp.]|nr:VC_2705 family sodium/solute symporter [Ramlibacter sp.]
APLVYGKQLQKIAEIEKGLVESPAEKQVQAEYKRRAAEYEARLANVDAALQREREAARERIRQLKAQGADSAKIVAANRELAALPKDDRAARELWTRALQESHERSRPLGGLPAHGTPFVGDPQRTPADQDKFDSSRLNFLALMFCLMVGTAGLPHLLTRFYTTPNVAEARYSVAWALFFISLVYLSVPALAVLVKFEVMQGLVGRSFEALPAWIVQWGKVDASLISVSDINGDGVVQFGEIRLGADIIMLATPEIGGLPYVVSGLVAAGGLAAALSTADGLLLTISNALVHDLYAHEVSDHMSPEQRVILSKFALLGVALLAAMVATLKPADILPLVSASFSLAASALVPAMVLGIFWRGATRAGAVSGMLAGLSVTVYYMLVNATAVRLFFKLPPERELWLGILPVSSGVFGVVLGLAVAVVVSLADRIIRLSPRPV